MKIQTFETIPQCFKITQRSLIFITSKWNMFVDFQKFNLPIFGIKIQTFETIPQCFKITQVSFYNFKMKYIFCLFHAKSCKMRLFEPLWYGFKCLNFHAKNRQKITRQLSLNRTQIGGKCQISKIQMRHFE